MSDHGFGHLISPPRQAGRSQTQIDPGGHEQGVESIIPRDYSYFSKVSKFALMPFLSSWMKLQVLRETYKRIQILFLMTIEAKLKGKFKEVIISTISRRAGSSPIGILTQIQLLLMKMACQ
jgi:hypothetical protein